MALYTDGVIRASKAQIEEALANFDDEEVAARQATAPEIQEIIDADSNLTSAEIVASADEIDSTMGCRSPYPADIGTPKFWESQVNQIVINGGQDLGSNKVRMRKDKMQNELSRISALL